MMSSQPQDTKIQTAAGFIPWHRLSGHRDLIRGVAWSPDGSQLATAASDRNVRVWDPENERNRILRGHTGSVITVAWSPDGKLATGSKDCIVGIWNPQADRPERRLKGHTGDVNCVAFSPDGKTLASASDDHAIILWSTESWQPRLTLSGPPRSVKWVAFSPDGTRLASAAKDNLVRIWDVETGKLLSELSGHSAALRYVAFSPDGKMLASASDDSTVRIWDAASGQALRVLEGHSGPVGCVTFSHDSKLCASRSADGTVRLWRCDTWELASLLRAATPMPWIPGLAFHPKTLRLAVLDQEKPAVQLFNLDLGPLHTVKPAKSEPRVEYTNARVVLVGDRAAGKSGLALALTGKPFETTAPTHARKVYDFSREEVALSPERSEIREILLWDLAGQPDYRLIHQVHLSEADVALIVYDAQNDPFAGVRYWSRALRQAQAARNGRPIKIFLVAAKIDVGGLPASLPEIEKECADRGFDGHFETSAKEGTSIEELRTAIHSAIDWQSLPSVSSPKLFTDIKDFLLAQREKGHLLVDSGDLYREFLNAPGSPPVTPELPQQFDTCIDRLAQRDLLYRLRYGHLVLLQPELLDAYTSAIVSAAKADPQGLGCLKEEDILAVRFPMQESERIQDAEQEKKILTATMGDLLDFEIALRETTAEASYLVFPSQIGREAPARAGAEPACGVSFTFEGAVGNLYATLVVRLAHSLVLKAEECWRNTATFTALAGGTCGIALNERKDGSGEISLFFTEPASEQTRFEFEEYIKAHLQQRAAPGSVHRMRAYACPACRAPIHEDTRLLRLARGCDSILCPVCGEATILLVDRETRLQAVQTRKMEQNADLAREREQWRTLYDSKVREGTFDVFFSYNSKDVDKILALARQLRQWGLRAWVDRLYSTGSWMNEIPRAINAAHAAAVFCGAAGIGPWEDEEQQFAFNMIVTNKRPLVPVILKDYVGKPVLPGFLPNRTFVDFRETRINPVAQFLTAVTGDRRFVEEAEDGQQFVIEWPPEQSPADSVKERELVAVP